MRYWLYILLFSAIISSPALAQETSKVEGVPTLDELATSEPKAASANNNEWIAETGNIAEEENIAGEEQENVAPENLNAEDILAEIKNNEKQLQESQPEVLSPQGLQDEMPNTKESYENMPATEAESADQTAEETLDDTEEFIQLDVFEPEFMNSLMKCQPNNENNNGRVLKIVGLIEDKCQLKYGNYILNLPPTILNNIHSFDDLHTIIKNSDFADYEYSPSYTYEGLIYALDACAHNEEYMGIEEEENLVDAVVTRGLNSKYADDACTIYLQNELDLDGKYFDYGVICKLPQSEVNDLEPYFKDIVEKYEAPEANDEKQPKEVQDADVALMYYLQKNGFCRQNKPKIK